jgi:hypothetical protein
LENIKFPNWPPKISLPPTDRSNPDDPAFHYL